MSGASSPNTLGLDFDQLQIQDSSDAVNPTNYTVNPTDELQHTVAADATDSKPLPQSQAKDDQAPASTNAAGSKEKKKPYVNPERVKTGGNQRDKLSEEALSERMARMREQNEKIKQRRQDVQADEEAFKKTQEAERAKITQVRKVQETVDRAREQNAKRKMEKIQSREWDSGKPAADWKNTTKKPPTTQDAPTDVKDKVVAGASNPSSPSRESGGWTRGSGPRGGSQRGSGRGRGRGGSVAGKIGKRDQKSPARDAASSPVSSQKVASTETPEATAS